MRAPKRTCTATLSYVLATNANVVVQTIRSDKLLRIGHLVHLRVVHRELDQAAGYTPMWKPISRRVTWFPMFLASFSKPKHFSIAAMSLPSSRRADGDENSGEA